MLASGSAVVPATGESAWRVGLGRGEPLGTRTPGKADDLGLCDECECPNANTPSVSRLHSNGDGGTRSRLSGVGLLISYRWLVLGPTEGSTPLSGIGGARVLWPSVPQCCPLPLRRALMRLAVDSTPSRGSSGLRFGLGQAERNAREALGDLFERRALPRLVLRHVVDQRVHFRRGGRRGYLAGCHHLSRWDAARE